MLSNNLKISTATDHRSTTTLKKCDLDASMLHLLKIPYMLPWMPRTIQKPGGLSLHQRRCQPFQFIVQAIIASPSALLPSKSRNKSNNAYKQEIVVSNTNFIIILILFIDHCQFLLTRYITVLVVIHHRQLSSAEVSQHH